MRTQLIISILALVIASIFNTSSKAQNLSLYTDYLDKVYVFDNGVTKQIEHLPIKSYQIGNNTIAYEDNSGNFKVYYDNYTFTLSGFVSEYFNTDNLVIYRLNTQLKVFDKGQNISLTTSVGAFAGNDDLVIFFDNQEQKLKAYYEGKVYELDDALAADEMNDFIAGEDVIIYKDTEGYYNIFYDGKIIQLLYGERTKSFKSGRGILAFVEDPMNNFQVFYNEEFIELDGFEPQSYQTGDYMVAYVDANYYLKVFYRGEDITISFDMPGFYKTVDELILFSVQNYFKVFWQGHVYTLESYIPNKYVANNNIIAYIDEHGYLKVFEQGKASVVSYEQIKDFEINGSAVNYSFGVHSQNIYFEGETFTNN